MVDAAIILFNKISNLIAMNEWVKLHSVKINYNEDIFTSHCTVQQYMALKGHIYTLWQ